MEVLSVSEELIFVKEKTASNSTGNPSAVPSVDTDVSNIVPFASETPGAPANITETAAKEAAAENPSVPSPAVSAEPATQSASAENVARTPQEPVTTPESNPAIPAAEPVNHVEPAVESRSTVSESPHSESIATDSQPSQKAYEFRDMASSFADKASELTDKASELTGKATELTGKAFKKVASRPVTSTDDEMPDDDPADKKRFHFKKEDKEFYRDKWILSRISDENLMDYLTLEQKRNEMQQQARDIKEKRIMKGFELTISLAAIVAVIYLLKDNPTILVNILYITGILVAFWFWKNPRDK